MLSNIWKCEKGNHPKDSKVTWNGQRYGNSGWTSAQMDPRPIVSILGRVSYSFDLTFDSTFFKEIVYRALKEADFWKGAGGGAPHDNAPGPHYMAHLDILKVPFSSNVIWHVDIIIGWCGNNMKRYEGPPSWAGVARHHRLHCPASLMAGWQWCSR